MSTVKITRRENPFAQIDKSVLEDDAISWKAKGVIAYLLSKPDGWEVRITDIVNHGPKEKNGQAKKGNGEDAIYQALKELRTVGYAELVIKRDRGVIVGKSWVVFEVKQQPKPDKPNRDNPDLDNPALDNTPINNNDLRDNDYFINNDLKYSAEINSAIPEMPNQSKPKKEKGTPGAEPWTREVATLFDRVNQEESAAAGIEYVAFNWQANSGMNFKNLELIRKAIIQDLRLGCFEESRENIIATFERCFRSSFQYFLDVANGVGGVVSFTPLKIYQKYNDVKSYAQRGKQRKQTKSDIVNQQRAKAIFDLAADDSQPGLFDY
jgi:hypothetical protein